VQERNYSEEGRERVDNHPVDLKADVLRGKQSVRVTFRLRAETIALLSMAAHQLGIKQKTLFDQLAEDQEILTRVVYEARKYSIDADEKVQKTFVISRNSLTALKNIAKMSNISRDLLVELSINRLRPVIIAEQEKQKRWKILLEKMEDLVNHGQLTLNEASRLLIEEDQMFQRIRGLVNALEKGCREIHQLIEKGNKIAGFK
jgi:hypothetical protein